MSLGRTPPPASPLIPLNQAQSEPNLPHSLLHSDHKNVNTQNRSSKRPCSTTTPGGEMRELEDDIKEIRNAWKVEQEANLNRVLTE